MGNAMPQEQNQTDLFSYNFKRTMWDTLIL